MKRIFIISLIVFLGFSKLNAQYFWPTIFPRIEQVWATRDVPSGINQDSTWLSLANYWTLGGKMTGTFQYTGANPVNGYVLTTDGFGNATWQAPSGGVSLINTGYGTSGGPITSTGTIIADTLHAVGSANLATQYYVLTHSSDSALAAASPITRSAVGKTVTVACPTCITSSNDSIYAAGFGIKSTIAGLKHSFSWDSTQGTLGGSRPATEYYVLNNSSKISGLTTNYVTKATSSSSIGNSIIYDNGTQVGIGTNTPSSVLEVAGNATIDNNALLGVPSSISGRLVFYDNTNSYYVGLNAGTTATGNINFTLPVAMPAGNGYALVSTTSGVMSFANIPYGNGSNNFISKWLTAGTLGNSSFFDDGTYTALGNGGASQVGTKFFVLGNTSNSSNYTALI